MSAASTRAAAAVRRSWACGVAAVLVAVACSGPATSAPDAAAASAAGAAFTLSSPAVVAGGRLPAEFTCDGAAANPPLSWRGAPAGTAGFAVVMHHVAGPGDVHWYWVVHGLGASVDHLDANAAPPGRLGTNSVNGRSAYAPPCSQGPGDKTYTLTVYALARQPDFTDPGRVSRQVLLDAIAGHVLAEASIDVVYARPANAGSPTNPQRPGGAPR
jgi:phosphatidylethanolamine-binding protein (PEBP) family uncharacterized protein